VVSDTRSRRPARTSGSRYRAWGTPEVRVLRCAVLRTGVPWDCAPASHAPAHCNPAPSPRAAAGRVQRPPPTCPLHLTPTTWTAFLTGLA
ncbi:hypothetical protein HLK59_41595, partial [Streptomyces sp. S3(2020)]|uniref:hypothetical protein n=1 Tax=Streptomyces sp. S3(2020) TaxID=2732044 RepID=UPI00180C2F29